MVLCIDLVSQTVDESDRAAGSGVWHLLPEPVVLAKQEQHQQQPQWFSLVAAEEPEVDHSDVIDKFLADLLMPPRSASVVRPPARRLLPGRGFSAAQRRSHIRCEEKVAPTFPARPPGIWHSFGCLTTNHHHHLGGVDRAGGSGPPGGQAALVMDQNGEHQKQQCDDASSCCSVDTHTCDQLEMMLFINWMRIGYIALAHWKRLVQDKKNMARMPVGVPPGHIDFTDFFHALWTSDEEAPSQPG